MSVVVSVVVPTYKREDLLRRCLEALIAQDFPPDHYEVLIADDAVLASTREVVKSYAQSSRCHIRYVPVIGMHGPAAARNAGWHEAAGKFIAFTDDDCLPQPTWLKEGVHALEQGADAATGRVVMPLPPEPTDYERDAAGLATAEFVTANCFVRRAALKEVGGFDERFRMAWREDSDLHFSLIEHGLWVTTAPDAVVVHPIRPAPWGVSLRMHRKTLYDALLYKKHPKLYRQRIHPFPWRYYAVAAAAIGAIVGIVLHLPALAAGGMIVWLVLTLEFCWRRLQGASRSPSHVAEMIYTSALIPFLSLYWRIRGALQYRVWFLH
jgi:GT2 family glycosyltransferase